MTCIIGYYKLKPTKHEFCRSVVIKLVLNKYIYLLAGAFAVAIPLSYFAISKYIEGFAHQTAISWWLFAIAAIVVTAISLITLMWQVNRAMKINPARVLKGE